MHIEGAEAFDPLHLPHCVFSQAEEVTRAMDEYVAVGAPLGDIQLAPKSSISGPGVRKTLAGMHAAHKLLSSQAATIKAVFPPGMSQRDFNEKVCVSLRVWEGF